MLNTNIQTDALQPRIYFINLRAIQNGNLKLWATTVAAFTLEEAQNKALKALQLQDPNLFNEGTALGGWNLQNQISLDIPTIDAMLERAYDQREADIIEQAEQQKNEIMKTILDTASYKLLDKYANVLTDAEVAYLKEEIAKYEPAN